MSRELPILIIVVPCYNEADVLPITAPLFRRKLSDLVKQGAIHHESAVCFINDGSNDGTWEIIRGLAAKDEAYLGISLSRNRGHQNALLAGLLEMRMRCDVTISIDCDGQDDIDAIDRMIEEYSHGAEVVYGVRRSRESDSPFKRTSAEAFYKLLSSMGAETIFNHADYRLLSKKALDGLAQYEERNLYLRGMVPLVGFESAIVEYDRTERLAGRTHYPLRKMISLAIDGVTSLSTKPIRVISGIGIVFGIIGLAGILWASCTALSGHAVSGWASMICVVCLLGGLQLLALGIIGEYIGKIYLETKRRPRYIVSARTWEET